MTSKNTESNCYIRAPRSAIRCAAKNMKLPKLIRSTVPVPTQSPCLMLTYLIKEIDNDKAIKIESMLFLW